MYLYSRMIQFVQMIEKIQNKNIVSFCHYFILCALNQENKTVDLSDNINKYCSFKT